MTSRRIEPPDPAEPIEPDIEPARRERARFPVGVLCVIGIGGGLGALARYGLARWWPTPPGGFPWATFVTNVSGCFLIGVLMVAITDIRTAHPLVRPFLGVGVLGGFTTFSTYADEARDLLRPDTVVTGFGYLAGTLVCALLATLAAMRLTRGVYEGVRARRKGAA
ncbi:CrcB family protein [Nocardia sp. BMG51109]|uniref:fluoride efflux transporter FluC n=1 Tax=Nocardia sp. BMG51109 TaxID=1056816 RepID=UPI00046664E4|nr:CrcB family protein [Nocardia sp. BMG51109]